MTGINLYKSKPSSVSGGLKPRDIWCYAERYKPCCSSLTHKSVLSPSLVGDDGHRVRQVQAALVGTHGQAQTLRERKAFANVHGQTAGLRSKHKPIAGLKCHVVRGAGAFGGHGKHAGGVGFGIVQKRGPVGVAQHGRVLVVVQARAAHVLVFHREAQRFDQMQGATGVGRQADDIARVGWDFGVDEDDVEHAPIVLHALNGKEIGKKNGKSLPPHV